MTMSTIISALVVTLLTSCMSDISWGKNVDMVAIGIRGGMNFQKAGLPPGEKEDFEQFDVFAVVGLPWAWENLAGWDVGWRLTGSVGALRGAGDLGVISTLTPGLAFTKHSWHMTVDLGAGGALLSDWEFGRQDIGGPFQFIGHGGLSFHLPGNVAVGYRFHHMSDGTIYGKSRGVDFHMLELSYHFET